MTTNQKIRSIQILNLIASIIAIMYVFYSGDFYLLLISYLVFVLFCPIGISACLHRLLSHKSYKTFPVIEKIMVMLSVYATVGSPIAWVAIHRAHHGFADKENDPHSPHKDNKLNLRSVLSAWTGYGSPSIKIPTSFIKDLIKDPFYKVLHNHYFKILLIPVGILFLISPILAMFLYSLPATLALNTTSIVNVLGHTHGYRSYTTNDQSSNSWIANIFSLGEGWHNNHHKSPNKFSTKEKSHEWDLIGFFIKLIRI